MEALLEVHKHVTRKQGEEDKLDVVESLTGIFDIHLVSYFTLLMCVFMHGQQHSWGESEDNLRELLLFYCVYWALNSGCQLWWQTPLLSEPS